MTYTAFSRRTWIIPLALLLVLIGALHPRAASAQAGQAQLRTKYFTIVYPTGEEQTAQWYAGFVDDVDESVSELLGSDPIGGINLTIYNTESEYARANPVAETHPGVMAHAIPQEKEVGVAVERLRQVDPAIARDSFRHEMTHVIAGALSGQNLPVGFQEGLAQYNELSTSRAQEVVGQIEDAESKKVDLVSWHDMNDNYAFRRSMDIAYPQAYTVMAFLADRYGMGDFARFLERLNRGDSYEDALFIAYGRKADELEQEWRDYLPGFLESGWKINVLTDYDMAPSITLYNGGQFAQARDGFSRSERLYRDLGRTSLAASAAGYRNKADKAQKASDTAAQARQELEAHDYEAANKDANEAVAAFRELQLDNYRQSADGTASLAQQGLDALTALESAREHARTLDFGGASSEARQAGETFALLGDQAHVDEVNEIMAGLVGWQRLAALLLLGVGVLVVLAGIAAAFYFARRRSRGKTVAAYLREENASWL